DAHGREYLAFVKRESQGLSLVDNWSGFGQRVTGSGAVKFDRVFVAYNDVIPFDVAFDHPTLVGPFAQIMHAAIEVGI
ncbi:SfnB family sulfur acquisition oxidoreductase, partial [Acinetobacter baumannii]